ncbi:hypothetical protein, partial [uncultured Chryseobacterium sp.]|uniref:hypothetical protein n=1 Tax=uncultured Chryseobacterium sp. TaxID=259322 RepID=UPI0025FAC129
VSLLSTLYKGWDFFWFSDTNFLIPFFIPKCQQLFIKSQDDFDDKNIIYLKIKEIFIKNYYGKKV